MSISYKNGKYNIVNVIINKEPGIYTLGSTSSEGKTWLCNTLKSMRLRKAPVIGYSYDDYKFGTKLKDLLDAMPDCKVLMLDRYDMYKGLNCDKFKNEIQVIKNHCIVLVDCKGDCGLDIMAGFAIIKLNSSLEIEVS